MCSYCIQDDRPIRSDDIYVTARDKGIMYAYQNYVESIATINPSIVAHFEERKAKLEHY